MEIITSSIIYIKMSALAVGNDDDVGTSADSFTSNSTEQQQTTEAPCCYMGYCPKCETNASIEVEQWDVEGEHLSFNFISLICNEDTEDNPLISINGGYGSIDEDGAPFIKEAELPDGHVAMVTYFSKRPLKENEIFTMVWDQSNRDGELAVGLATGFMPMSTIEENIPTSMISLNVYDEHLNLFIPDEIAQEGHVYEYEQTHLIQKHKCNLVARPGTRISIKMTGGNIPLVQFGNLNESNWYPWCPDGAGLKPGEDGCLYPVISLVCKKGKASPIVRNIRIVQSSV